jgi:hypothetical protein
MANLALLKIITEFLQTSGNLLLLLSRNLGARWDTQDWYKEAFPISGFTEPIRQSKIRG